jgi:hypothetical protein
MLKPPSASARHTVKELGELKRKEKLETLRKYLIEAGILATIKKKDATITIDHLKKLARVWKLHHEPGFWKNHGEKDQLVTALHGYIEANFEDTLPQKKRQPRKPPGNKSTFGAKHRNVKQPVSSLSNQVDDADVFKPYAGDIFGTRGDYEEGMVYLSRMQAPGAKPGANNMLKDFLAVDPASQGGKQIEGDANNDGIVDEQEERELKQKCASGLYNYSKYDNCETKMCNEHAVAAIQKLAAIGDEDASKSCAATLCNLSAFEPTRDIMFKERALHTLAMITRVKNETTKLFVAKSYNHLSMNEAFLNKIVEDTASGALSSLLGSESEETRELACMSFVNLAGYDEDRPVNEDVLPCLGGLAKSKNPQKVLFTSDAIRNLSCLSTNHARIMEGGAVEILSGMVASAESDEIKKNACIALTNLTNFKNGREKMIKEKAVETLMTLAEMSDPMVKVRCALALSNLCCTVEARRTVIEKDVVKTLVALAKLPMNSAKQALERVIAAISCLSGDPEKRELMVEQGASEALLALGKQEKEFSSAVIVNIVIALCNFTAGNPGEEERGKKNCSTMQEQGVIADVIRFSKMEDPQIKLHCVCAICNMSMYRVCLDKLLGDSIVPALIEIADTKLHVALQIGDADSEKLQKISAATLNNLSSYESSRSRMVKEGVVPALSSLSKLDDPKTRTYCAASLCYLTYHEDSQTKIIDDGAVPTLIELSREGEAETRLRCAGALCNLSRLEIGGDGGDGLLPALLEMSKSEDPRIMHRCAGAFYKLSMQTDSCALMAQNEKLGPGLITMMRSGHGETQLFAAKTLCNVTTVSGSEEKMLATPNATAKDQNAVKDFVTIAILRVNNDMIKEICAKAFFNLLVKEGDSRKRMIDESVLWAIVKLAETVEMVEVKKVCAQVIYNLACDDDTQEVLIQTKAVRTIDKVAEFDSETARRNCAASLMKLSCRRGDEAMNVQLGAIKAAQNLSKLDDELSKWNCATVLCNLSFDQGSREQMVIDKAIPSLIDLAKTKDIETSKLCVTALCNLSYERNSHEEMVADGASDALIGYLTQYCTPGPAEAEENRKQILTLAATALYNISTHVDSRAKIVEAKGVPALVKACSQSDTQPLVLRLCCKILVAATSHEPSMERIVKEKAVPLLLEMADPAFFQNKEYGDEMQPQVATAFSNLSRCEVTQATIVGEGLMTVIKLLVQCESELINRRCAAMLRNTSCNKDASDILCATQSDRDLLMKTIKALALAKDMETQLDVTVALTNFCTQHGIDALEGAIATLIALSKSGNEETKEICGLAVHNLSGQTTKLEDGSVSALLSLMDHDKDKEPAPVNMGAADIIPTPAEFDALEKADGQVLNREVRDMKPNWDKHEVRDSADVPVLPSSMKDQPDQQEPIVSFHEELHSSFEKMEGDSEKV